MAGESAKGVGIPQAHDGNERRPDSDGCGGQELPIPEKDSNVRAQQQKNSDNRLRGRTCKSAWAKDSGLSIQDFCETTGLDPDNVMYWLVLLEWPEPEINDQLNKLQVKQIQRWTQLIPKNISDQKIKETILMEFTEYYELS